jgi:hypothetical protein
VVGLFCRLEFLEQDQGSARETYRGELATMEQRLRNTQVRAAAPRHLCCQTLPNLSPRTKQYGRIRPEPNFKD